MAKLVYGLNQSLDGYVDHREFKPSLALFRHFIDHVRNLTGIVYARRMYEVMRYWTKTLRAGSRRNTTSRRRDGAGRSGLCRAR
jgi:hypothetical protein